MKAPVVGGPGQGFKVREVEIADPVDREVLIDVTARAVITDLS